METTEIVDDKYDATDFYLGVTGMKVAVKREVDDLYYELENGLYINKEDAVKLDGEVLKQSVLGKATWNVTARYTYLHIPTTEEGMCAIYLQSKSAVINLYGVAGGLTAEDLPENPLFSAVEISSEGDTVTINLTYEKANYIFGYTAYYKNGELIIRFMNPLVVRNDELPLEGYRISLDPGHSNTVGSETVYNGKKYRENVLDYDLALRVKEKLEAYGATVELTHQNEREKDLDTLIEEMRARLPDMNVSIHFNWLHTSKTHGTTTWWCYENSRLLASSLQNKFCEITELKNRGIKKGYYKVSRFCEFPSVLFETLYISTPDEFEWYITSETHQELVAEGIAQGILAFFKAQ